MCGKEKNMTATSFRLFGLQEKTETVVQRARNDVYDQMLRVDRDVERLNIRKATLIKDGKAARAKGQKSKFLSISRELKEVETELSGKSRRQMMLKKQVQPLERAGDRLSDVRTAKAIVSANRRVLKDYGTVGDALSLARDMQQTNLEMEEGVPSILDELFEPDEGDFSAEEILDDEELEELWNNVSDEEETGRGNMPLKEEDLFKRLELLNLPSVTGRATSVSLPAPEPALER